MAAREPHRRAIYLDALQLALAELMFPWHVSTLAGLALGAKGLEHVRDRPIVSTIPWHFGTGAP